MTPQDFDDRVKALCAGVGAEVFDPATGAAMIETLAGALGFTIAMTARGNSEAINVLCEGASQHLFERCAEHQNAGAVLSALCGQSGRLGNP